MTDRPEGGREPFAGPDDGPQPPFPLKLSGKVIKGFGRGSSELGIATANIPLEGLSIGGHSDIESGVYYGWAGLSPCKATQQNPPEFGSKYTLMAPDIFDSLSKVALEDSADSKNEGVRTEPLTKDSGAVYPMVVSIGYNPYYKNEKRSVEVHIMHHFERDFYDAHMNLIILAFIRPELDYISKEKLIEDIKTDIDVSGRSLARKPYADFRKDKYLVDFEGKGEIAS